MKRYTITDENFRYSDDVPTHGFQKGDVVFVDSSDVDSDGEVMIFACEDHQIPTRTGAVRGYALLSSLTADPEPEPEPEPEPDLISEAIDSARSKLNATLTLSRLTHGDPLRIAIMEGASLALGLVASEIRAAVKSARAA